MSGISDIADLLPILVLLGGGGTSQQGFVPEGSVVWSQGCNERIYIERIERCIRAKARHEHGMSWSSRPSPPRTVSAQFYFVILASNECFSRQLVFCSDIQNVAGAQNEESRVCYHKGDLGGQKLSILHGAAGTVMYARDLAVCFDHIGCCSHSIDWHFQNHLLQFLCGTVQAQAATHWKFGDLETAYDLAKRVQGGIERLFGSRSEMLPSALLLLGLILTSLGELREAEQILNRSQSLSVTIWGEGGVAASIALFALAMVRHCFSIHLRSTGFISALTHEIGRWRRGRASTSKPS